MQRPIKTLKTAVNSALGAVGLELRRRLEGCPLASGPVFDGENAAGACALVGYKSSFRGPYKATPDLYFPKFQYRLAKAGVRCNCYPSPKAFAEQRGSDGATVAILIYNEEQGRTQFDEIEAIERSLPPNVIVANSSRIGRLIGDKRATNARLSSYGIKMPPIVDQHVGHRIFSNASNFGSKKPTTIADEWAPIDPARYNTVFVDTRSTFKGRDYYVALRALAVGGTMVSAYVRLRTANEGDASVHAKNTPLDPLLINHFHAELVEAKAADISRLCRQIGDALGLGFYAHDILLCRDTGELYLCETGFKFDDDDYRRHLWPISSDLPALARHFSFDIAEDAATALLSETRITRELVAA